MWNPAQVKDFTRAECNNRAISPIRIRDYSSELQRYWRQSKTGNKSQLELRSQSNFLIRDLKA